MWYDLEGVRICELGGTGRDVEQERDGDDE